jgi:signal transduction histidine kinase/CheY-like chemotaxis protein
VHFTTADGLPQPQVESLFVSRDGTVWCGTCAGVARYDGTCFQTLDSRDGLAGNQQVLVIAEGREGEMWFGCKDGISSFRANNVAPVCRIVGVQTDKDFTDLPTLPRFTVGTRLTLKFDSLDFKTVPEKRLYRCRILEGAHSVDELGSGGESPRQEGWLPARHDTRFEFTPPKAGIYTFAVQAIDRDLNYSKPVAATLTIVPPWYLNAKIAGPIAAGNLGLIVWAFVARLLYRAKRREAERLKEQMLAQEHEAREALEAKNAQLESAKVAVEAKAAQLVESNTQLAAAKDAADSANKAKSLFLANMSHEIRTPMNAILGYSQILRRDAELPPKYRASIETIEKSGDHLLAMINDILDLSKIEAGRMELQESDFDLGSLVQGLAEMFRVRCEEKQLELRVEWGSAECGVRSAESESRFATHVEGEKGGKGEEGHGQEGHVPALSPSPFPPFPPAPLAVRGDEGKLRQVLINLLGNAVKFTERGSVVLRLESRLQPVGASDTLTGQQGCGETHAADRLKAGLRTYCFEVIDTGKGISPENLRDLFQPFQQGAEGRKKGGTGLGLAITKRQVELMGGTIGVESEVGQGSRFFFEIPLAPAQGEIVARTEKPTREVRGFKAGTRVRALVVDDVRQNREVLSQMLAGIGCEVAVAEGGLEALAWLRSQRSLSPSDALTSSAGPEVPRDSLPDIVFLDIRMPELDGTEVLRRIVAEFGRGRMKLVAISASVFKHEQQSYLDTGFDAFIGKPFRFEEICGCLHRLLHVEFQYASEEAAPAPAPAALDPDTVSLAAGCLTALRDAAARYSVTRLEKGFEELEQDGETGRAVAAYLRRLVNAGDLDAVSAFLERVHERKSNP